MSNMNRRSFIGLLGAAAGLGLAGAPAIASAAELLPKKGRRVVVVGGGYGGAIAAKHIRLHDPSIEVVLIERNRSFVSCPFSNLVVGGFRDIRDNTIAYDKLAANHGIHVVYDEVTAIDTAARKVVVSGGSLGYDRLVLSPGIDFRFEEIEGYDPVETPRLIPHAWKAGEQTLLLRRQLVDLPKGGTVVMSIPLAPFRCPPGPYERISMMAWHLKHHNPGARIIVLDANPDIVSKGALFRKAWEKHYQGMIEYRSGSRVLKVDGRKRTVDNGVEEIRGDLVNLVPPQKAGLVAHRAGVVGEDGKWCPVDPLSFESTLVKGVHVIGDACMAGAMPKSGYSANSQAKVCATNLVRLMNGQELVDPSHANVCYSYVTEREAISVAFVYRVEGGKTVAVPDSGGVSPDLSEEEAVYAQSWIRNILHEMST